jgi:hypothetical protein
MDDLAKVEGLANQLEGALAELIDISGRWLDVPVHYIDNDFPDGYGERHEMECAFCASRFWAIEWDAYGDGNWYYYQAGYWFGKPGEGHHFPVCSDGCYSALERQLEKRRLHTAGQMQQIAKAKRLIGACRATVKRMKREQRPEGCATLDAGSR